MAGSATRWGTSAAVRYPDPDVVVLDPGSEDLYRQRGIRRIATGFDFTEGPVWFGDGRYLLFSDIPNDRILRWDETPAGPACFASRRIMPTATRGIGRGG